MQYTTDLNMMILGGLLLNTFPALAQQDNENTRTVADGYEIATFAGGCFWCMEPPFDKLEGVISTTSGYTGGHKQDPTYQEVSAGSTGHAEAVRITFDPKTLSYQDLLEKWYFRMHDPTTQNRQGPDVGSQYRSAVFTHSPQQQAAAEALKSKLAHDKRFARPIVTEITPASAFWPAEEYHQRYAEKHGGVQCPLPPSVPR